MTSSSKINEENNIDPQIMEFLFILHKKRSIPPVYMIFTKIGFIYFLIGATMFYYSGFGVFSSLIYFLIGRHIYNNEISFRNYEKDKLFFMKMMIDYLSIRKETKKYTNTNPLTKGKIHEN